MFPHESCQVKLKHSFTLIDPFGEAFVNAVSRFLPGSTDPVSLIINDGYSSKFPTVWYYPYFTNG